MDAHTQPQPRFRELPVRRGGHLADRRLGGRELLYHRRREVGDRALGRHRLVAGTQAEPTPVQRGRHLAGQRLGRRVGPTKLEGGHTALRAAHRHQGKISYIAPATLPGRYHLRGGLAENF
jgi:hypothetical protein